MTEDFTHFSSEGISKNDKSVAKMPLFIVFCIGMAKYYAIYNSGGMRDYSVIIPEESRITPEFWAQSKVNIYIYRVRVRTREEKSNKWRIEK